jgi:glucokinase
MANVIGIDIGGTKCAVVLATAGPAIRIVDRVTFLTATDRDFQYDKGRIFAAVRDLMAKHDLATEDITAIGVSCGGPLNSKQGIVLCPPNLPNWVNVPIVHMLEEEFGIPSYLQNDAKACALVEWRLGAGRGCHNMIFLTMGTGMGSGIIANDELICGANDMGGEVGHIRIEKDGPVGFGKHGSFEGFTSGGGIARLAQQMAREALARNDAYAFGKNEGMIDRLDTKTLAEFARNGDADAIGIFSIVGEKLGRGIAYLIDILNPEAVVIGSIFVRCEDLLRPWMEEVLDKECISFSRQACRVVPAQTGESIGDLASVMVAVHGHHIPLHEEGHGTAGLHLETLLDRYPALVPLKDKIREAFNAIRRTYDGNGKLLCCGNGGSAADCDHIVGELMKGFRLQRKLGQEDEIGDGAFIPGSDAELLNQGLQGGLPAIALTQHIALSTAFSNDVEPQLVFAQQVHVYGQRGDALLVLSTSGNSRNVVLAAQVAKSRGLAVIAFTGPKPSRLMELADICINVPGDDTAQVQELHLPVYHTLCSMLEAAFFGEV